MGKIVKQMLSDQIFDYLQEEIMKGTWKPGEKLPSETELAKTLGVSRVSLRSAISRCSSLGLTETRVGEGTFVRKFNLRGYFTELYNLKLLNWSPETVLALRCALQNGAVSLALQTPVAQKDIAVLEKLYAQLESYAQKNDINNYHLINIQFNRVVCELSENEAISMFYDAIESILDSFTMEMLKLSIQFSGGYDWSLHYHKSLLECIQKQDINEFIRINTVAYQRGAGYFQGKNIDVNYKSF